MIALASEIEAWSIRTSAQGLFTMPATSSNPGTNDAFDHPTGSALTVLYIDCHPERLATRKKLLEFGGYRVLTASDVRHGLRLLETNHVYVIVLDYAAADTDDARVFYKHRPEVPVLMLSHRAKGIPQTILDLIGVSEELRSRDECPLSRSPLNDLDGQE